MWRLTLFRGNQTGQMPSAQCSHEYGSWGSCPWFPVSVEHLCRTMLLWARHLTVVLEERERQRDGYIKRDRQRGRDIERQKEIRRRSKKEEEEEEERRCPWTSRLSLFTPFTPLRSPAWRQYHLHIGQLFSCGPIFPEDASLPNQTDNQDFNLRLNPLFLWGLQERFFCLTVAQDTATMSSWQTPLRSSLYLSASLVLASSTSCDMF